MCKKQARKEIGSETNPQQASLQLTQKKKLSFFIGATDEPLASHVKHP